MENTRNVWLLISGPSGVGKTTLIEEMIAHYSPRLQLVITATTRAMRPGEREGEQYFFMTRDEFKRREAAGEFLETIERHGVYYGTPVKEVRDKLEQKIDLIMHIDWRGRQHLAKLSKDLPWMARAMTSVFIKPDNLESLKIRLQRRGRNTPEEIEARLKLAEVELTRISEYDYTFTTKTYEQDFQQLNAIYLAEKSRTIA
jgi:guanylate kinase